MIGDVSKLQAKSEELAAAANPGGPEGEAQNQGETPVIRSHACLNKGN